MYSCLNKSCEITSEVIRTKRSCNVHRAFTVHLAFLVALPSRFACARRSHPLNQFHSAFVHRSFTHRALCLRSTFFQHALYVYSPFMCVCRTFLGLYYHFSTKHSAIYEHFNLIICWRQKLNRICNGIHNGLYWFTTNGRYSFIHLLYISNRLLQNWFSLCSFPKRNLADIQYIFRKVFFLFAKVHVC